MTAERFRAGVRLRPTLDPDLARAFGQAVSTAAVIVSRRHVGAHDMAQVAEDDWRADHPDVDLRPLTAAMALLLDRLADEGVDHDRQP